MVVPRVRGLQNASAAIGTAYSASSPVLVVAGQIQRELIGADRGMLHEINDQLDTIKPVTKWAHRILDPAEIPAAVHEAFHQLKTGRPRPVEIEIPPETLEDQADIDLFEPEEYAPRGSLRRPHPTGRPHDSWREEPAPVRRRRRYFLQRIRCAGVARRVPPVPCANDRGGQRRSLRPPLPLDWRNELQERPLYAAHERSRHRWSWSARRNAYPGFLSQKVIQIDIDPEEIGRNYDDTYGLVGDARITLEKLQDALSAISRPRESRRAEMDAARAEREESDPKLEPQHSLTRAIRNAVPDDGIVISGMTQIGYYSRVNYPVYEPRTYLTSSYYGNLGYAYPVALGAKVAQPDKAVVAISGDGGFMFASQEMATAVKYGINAVVVVFNDSAFGNVLRDQVTRFDGRSIGAELHNPDFMKLADAYGMRGVRVEDADPNRLESALKESLEIEAPTLLEVPVGMMPNPFT